MTKPGDATAGTMPALGMLEWFHINDRERVERVAAGLKRLGISHLRTGVSWADWFRPDGAEWYDWLLPRLATDFTVVPCVVYTPPSIAVEPRSSAPPVDPRSYADFLDMFVDRLGYTFEWIELWNEPNNHNDWDSRLDPQWLTFCTMVGGAAYWMKQRGKKTLLAGCCPSDPSLLDLFGQRGVLQYIDAVGLHGFPGTWDSHWPGWTAMAEAHRAVLDRHGSKAELWISEVGYSTWRHDEHGQIRTLLEALAAPVERVYWYAYEDVAEELETQEGFHFDERHYHMGLTRASGVPKLAHRLLEKGGVAELQRLQTLIDAGPNGGRLTPVAQSAAQFAGPSTPARQRPQLRPVLPADQRSDAPIVVTGGAGFVGTNLADRLARSGRRVLVYDNLSRAGVEENLAWLKAQHPGMVEAVLGDVRDRYVLRDAVQRAAGIYHFAAQVAVTTSLVDPVDDFTINAGGMVALLEAVRGRAEPPPVVFTSTNKVYGKLADISVTAGDRRWEPDDRTLRTRGVPESRPLDLYSPYGCSKGTADQYALDYARIYGLPATVLRMSCIYGPHQFGTEDQGWVAHFLIQAMRGNPITLYGDGKQVRDVLFVEDLVDAMLGCLEKPEAVRGRVFNIGGGPGNATSLLELLERIEGITGKPVDVDFGPWRPGDQPWYVSDTRSLTAAIGWRPRVGIAEGVQRLAAWLVEAGLVPQPVVAAPALVVATGLPQRAKGRVAL